MPSIEQELGGSFMSRSMVRSYDSRALPDASLAAVLSFFLPGTGQLYNGKFLRAIFWFIVTPGLWIGTGGWLGWACHLVAAYTAYRYARSLR